MPVRERAMTSRVRVQDSRARNGGATVAGRACPEVLDRCASSSSLRSRCSPCAPTTSSSRSSCSRRPSSSRPEYVQVAAAQSSAPHPDPAVDAARPTERGRGGRRRSRPDGRSRVPARHPPRTSRRARRGCGHRRRLRARRGARRRTAPSLGPGDPVACATSCEGLKGKGGSMTRFGSILGVGVAMTTAFAIGCMPGHYGEHEGRAAHPARMRRAGRGRRHRRRLRARRWSRGESSLGHGRALSRSAQTAHLRRDRDRRGPRNDGRRGARLLTRLKERGRELRADLLVAVVFDHGEGGRGPTKLAARAIRFRDSGTHGSGPATPQRRRFAPCHFRREFRP